jgi:phosphocarrier protein HPr
MYASPVMIVNAAGIHARPASELVNYCKQFFNTSIYIINGEKRLNAKSIISLLSGGLKRGLEVTVSAEGENEEVVCKKVIAFIQALE